MTDRYYGNVNPDLLDRLPLIPGALMLDVGCGTGQLGRAYRARNPTARIWGAEVVSKAAEAAAGVLDKVFSGDVESPAMLAALDQARGADGFDVISFGDVLEHLHDPWRLLAELRSRAAPGAVCTICVPNVSHWSLIADQMRGLWTYADAGLLDRTHLRFFTRQTVIEMLSKAGWTVLDAHPRVVGKAPPEGLIDALCATSSVLGTTPEEIRREVTALQWVVRAVAGPAPQPLRVAALGMRRQAGVTEARVDHPLQAMASLPGVQATWSAGVLRLPRGGEPGILLLHRNFLNDPALIRAADGLAERGWVLVTDMDDDPQHWPAFVESDFRAFRGVHAVTVSTQRLADVVRAWNPWVEVMPNAIPRLSPLRPESPKHSDGLRIFFGALNREADWAEVGEGLLEAARRLGDRVEWVVVHDRSFHDALPDGTRRHFLPTLPYEKYAAALAEADIALLPLADNRFNWLKSDLKFIECLAAGVVPICSPVVYGDDPAHRALGAFAATPGQWRDALLRLCGEPQALSRMRAAGARHVMSTRMHANQASARASFYRRLITAQPALERDRQARLAAMSK